MRKRPTAGLLTIAVAVLTLLAVVLTAAGCAGSARSSGSSWIIAPPQAAGSTSGSAAKAAASVPPSSVGASSVAASASATDPPAPVGITLPAVPKIRAQAKPVVVTPRPPPPDPGVPVGAGAGINAAAEYATSRGYRVGVAVMDTQTGQVWGGGESNAYFASESVVKVFIAAKILVMGQMSGATADTAYKMITQSDDDSATALYGMVGGDGVVAWAASYFHVPDLGTAPTLAGWWSNTHITAVGMVQFYAAVKANATVWPWLSDAMAHVTQNGSDGTYQYFGIPSATTGWAVKQGWGQDDDDWEAASDFNSTGFVNNNRYAVAILLKGPPSGYNEAVPNMLTSVARVLMPGGVCTPAG